MLFYRRALINRARTFTEKADDEVGTPLITTEDGKITRYEYTEPASFDGKDGQNTNFVPFDGKNFSMTLKAKFTYADNSGSTVYPTLLNALEETEPYNGFLIRYEGSVLYFVHKSAHYNLSLDSNNYINMTIVLKDKTLTVTNNSTQVASISVDYTIDNLTIILGASMDTDGNIFRPAVATIDTFKIEKI